MSTPKAIIIAAIVIAISTVISTKLYVDSQPKYTFFDEGILKGNLLLPEKSYPIGVIAIFGNFFLKVFDTFFM